MWLVHCSYCNQYVDKEALVYLCLANDLLHQLSPDMITIAEDVNAKNVSAGQMWSTAGLCFPQICWDCVLCGTVVVAKSPRSLNNGTSKIDSVDTHAEIHAKLKLLIFCGYILLLL